MRRSFLILAAIVPLILLLAFFLTKPSAPSQNITVEMLARIDSHAKIQELRDAKEAALANLLERIVDRDSAREHTAAAQDLLLQLELINARSAMLPPDRDMQPYHTLTAQKPYTLLYNQCQRIGQSPALMRELTPALQLLFNNFQVDFPRIHNPAAVLAKQIEDIRPKLELYKIQHEGKTPDFRTLNFKPLTRRTDAAGAISSSGKFGPYIECEPENPLTKSSEFFFIHGTPPSDLKTPTNKFGYVYDEDQGRLWGLNANGTAFYGK